MKTDTFVVEDMHCDACVNTITKTLTSNENVSNVEANLSSKEVNVEYNEENYDVEEILSSLDMIGFPATVKKKP
jgi:copper chaperone CopZ